MRRNAKSLKVEITTDQRTVTGSSNLLSVKNQGEENLILVDYGINAEKNLYDELNSNVNFDLRKLRIVLLTHVHADHVAKLPILYRNGYKGKIILSKESNILLEDILRDNLKILIEESKKKAISPLYGEEDIVRNNF